MRRKGQLTRSKFFDNPQTVLACDASVIINLNATGIAHQILKSVPHQVGVVAAAWDELSEGASRGYDDAEKLGVLEREGLVVRMDLSAAGLKVYEELVFGSTENSLDDGEAGTIALAWETAGIALIDEARAGRLCRERYPQVEVMTTVDLLLHPALVAHLGTAHAGAILGALRVGRMSVPRGRLEEIISLIGCESARQCPSIPRLAIGCETSNACSS